MYVHVDTSILIAAMVSGSPAEARLRGWLAGPDTIAISSIAWAEFLCGPLDAAAQQMAAQMFPAPEPFLATDAVLAAQLFNATGRRSRSLADCMIAAVAMRCAAQVATNNRADFAPLEAHGLKLA